jgi:hypothetical protein
VTYFIRAKKPGDISSMWLSIDGGYTAKFEDAMPFTYLNNALNEASIGDDHVVEVVYAVKARARPDLNYEGGEYYTGEAGFVRPWSPSRKMAFRWEKERDANQHGSVLMGNAKVVRILKRVA